MDLYLKVTSGILITAIVSVVLSREGKDISLLLTLCVCSMVVSVAAVYLKPVLDFIQKLMQLSQINDQFLEIMLKTAGIGLLSQIACFVCADAGNQVLTKTLQVITTAVLLSISVPLLDQILSLLETILGEL